MPKHRISGELSAIAPVVLPSLLLCDFGNLEREISRLAAAGVKALHLDCMDGHFVPNMTYGLTIVEAVRRLTKLPLDVHLMISNPQDFVPKYRQAGADIITVHAETMRDPRPVLDQIRNEGAAAGLAINPPTPVQSIQHCLDLCDLVLVMSVMPGFGGQKFDPVALEKLQWLREHSSDGTLLEVDGGVNDTTIEACARAGAEYFVVGSGVFAHENYQERVSTLERLAQNANR